MFAASPRPNDGVVLRIAGGRLEASHVEGRGVGS